MHWSLPAPIIQSTNKLVKAEVSHARMLLEVQLQETQVSAQACEMLSALKTTGMWSRALDVAHDDIPAVASEMTGLTRLCFRNGSDSSSLQLQGLPCLKDLTIRVEWGLSGGPSPLLISGAAELTKLVYSCSEVRSSLPWLLSLTVQFASL